MACKFDIDQKRLITKVLYRVLKYQSFKVKTLPIFNLDEEKEGKVMISAGPVRKIILVTLMSWISHLQEPTKVGITSVAILQICNDIDDSQYKVVLEIKLKRVLSIIYRRQILLIVY